MTTIKLLDARRGLNLKCRELIRDEKVAETIYRYLCDGIEECEDAQPERKTGRWKLGEFDRIGGYWATCSACGIPSFGGGKYCRECGALMEGIDGK